ncbi:hypothetical protein PIB30_026490 [Stylosanthes scabra]|uniref:Uncharacterized protein n=1 Tax=Stylosanthes scabra TaxID=79078 RepID=A0ABU6XAH1_9FABA|nr:hypothetical protein [Stylosanthes scabra]
MDGRNRTNLDIVNTTPLPTRVGTLRDRLNLVPKCIIRRAFNDKVHLELYQAPSEVQNSEEINNQNNYNDTNEDFENGGDINYTNEFVQEDIADFTIVQSPPKEKRRKTSSKNVEKRSGIAFRLQNSIDRMLVSIESKAATKGDDPCSIENCIKLLHTLPGLDYSSI